MIKKIKAGGVTFSINAKKDLVKVSVGKETRYIKAADLWGVAFNMTEDKEMRDKLMPVRTTEVMKFKKVHTVAVKNDMKAGETLQFTCIIDVPTYVIDGLKDIIAEKVPEAVPMVNELIHPKVIPSEANVQITK